MSIKKLTTDTAALPTALLALAKSHLRVDWSYDDAFITSCIARAIDWFQRVTGVTVHATSYEWKPAQGEFRPPPRSSCIDPASVPVSPVGVWSATVNSVDVGASYTMESDTVHGVELSRLVGDWQTGLTLTIASGYATAAELPDGILDVVLRYTAHLYEHREILVPGSEQGALTPGWMTDVLATWWMPRA